MSPEFHAQHTRLCAEAARQQYMPPRTSAIVGIAISAVAMANLTQGIWIDRIPWLQFTLAGLAVLLLLSATLRFGGAVPKPGTLSLLLLSFIPGMLTPSLNPYSSQKRYDILIVVMLGVLIVYIVTRSPKFLASFGWGVLAFATVALLAQWLAPDPEALDSGRRAPLGNNAIATARALGLASLVALWFGTEVHAARRRRWVWLLIAALFVGGMVFASSRGPLLGWMVSVTVLLLATRAVKGATKVLMTISLCSAIVLAVRELAQSDSRLVNGGDSGRGTILSASWNVVQDQPLGVGWGNLYNYLPSSAIASEQGFVQYSHNVILEVLVEGGFVAAICLCVALIVTVKRAFDMRAEAWGPFVLGALLYALVGSLFSSDVSGNRLLWVMMAITLGLSARRNSRLIERSVAQVRIGSRRTSTVRRLKSQDTA